MSKATLPADVQMQLVGIVRGYERVRREYHRQRQDILNAGTGAFHSTMSTVGWTSRPTESTEARLEALDKYQAFRQMRAVDHALDLTCSTFPGEMGKLLRAALMVNTADGRGCPFERLNTIGVSRASFYRIKRRFFCVLAEELGLIV